MVKIFEMDNEEDMMKQHVGSEAPSEQRKAKNNFTYIAPGNKVVVINGDNAKVDMGNATPSERATGEKKETGIGSETPSEQDEEHLIVGIAIASGLMGLRMLAHIMEQ